MRFSKVEKAKLLNVSSDLRSTIAAAATASVGAAAAFAAGFYDLTFARVCFGGASSFCVCVGLLFL